MILDSVDGWDWDDINKTDYPVATTNLVASQQDYKFPTGLLKVKRVEVTYDGTNWYKAEPFDINMRGKATDTTSIANDFSTAAPYYDAEKQSVKLYPIPSSNVTAGLKIWYVREPSEFTSSEVTTGTKEPGFDEPFHVMIALGMCLDWFIAKEPGGVRYQATQQELAEYEARLRKYYGSKQADNPMSLNPAYVNFE